jgi:hypothetical protein
VEIDASGIRKAEQDGEILEPGPGSTGSTGSTLAQREEGFKRFRPLGGDGGKPTPVDPVTPGNGTGGRRNGDLPTIGAVQV